MRAPVQSVYVFVFTTPSFSLSSRKGDVEIHETGLRGSLDLDMGLLCPGLQLCAAGNVNIERAYFQTSFFTMLLYSSILFTQLPALALSART